MSAPDSLQAMPTSILQTSPPCCVSGRPTWWTLSAGSLVLWLRFGFDQRQVVEGGLREEERGLEMCSPSSVSAQSRGSAASLYEDHTSCQVVPPFSFPLCVLVISPLHPSFRPQAVWSSLLWLAPEHTVSLILLNLLYEVN